MAAAIHLYEVIRMNTSNQFNRTVSDVLARTLKRGRCRWSIHGRAAPSKAVRRWKERRKGRIGKKERVSLERMQGKLILNVALLFAVWTETAVKTEISFIVLRHTLTGLSNCDVFQPSWNHNVIEKLTINQFYHLIPVRPSIIQRQITRFHWQSDSCVSLLFWSPFW